MPELLDLATRVAADARPGEEVEAYVSWHRSVDARAYDGEVESLSVAEAAGIGVRVIVDHRQGFAYVGNVTPDAAREALAEARDNAGFATPDEHVGLARPDGVAPAVLDLWRDALGAVTTDEKIALALDLERRVRDRDARARRVVSTDYGDAASEAAIATSTGIAATSRQSVCYLSTDVLAGEGSDTQSAAAYTVGRAPGDLDADHAAGEAVRRATRLLGATKPPSARLTVVLDRRVTATLLGILSGTLSGEEVAKGRSLFAGRSGEQVAVAGLDLSEDPTDPEAFGASCFDAEGLACRPTALIEGGRLRAFLYDTYSARLAGTTSTASAVRGGFKSTPGVGARALRLVPGELDQEAILAAVGEGLFVQSVSGVHSGVNAVSGDFSVGAEGLMIRGGALAEPVREITIASTIQKMLLGVTHIGSDVERLPSAAVGVTLAIGDVALGGS